MRCTDARSDDASKVAGVTSVETNLEVIVDSSVGEGFRLERLTPPGSGLRVLDPIVMPEKGHEARASRMYLTDPLAANVSGSGYARSASSTKGIHVSA
jgi:hypothetical protein